MNKIKNFKDAVNNIKDFNRLINNLKTVLTNSTEHIDWDSGAILPAVILSVVMWWGMLTVDTSYAHQNDDDKIKNPKETEEIAPEETPDENNENKIEKTKESEQNKLPSIFDNKETLSQTYNPADKDFIQTFVDDNWPHIVAGLLEFETWFSKNNIKIPKKDQKCTYGPGLTYVYTKNAKGDWESHECKGKYVNKARHMSDAEIWQQVKIHLLSKGTGLPQIKSALINQGVTEISAQKLLGLLFAAYQMPGHITKIINDIQPDSTDSEIMEAFRHYNGEKDFEDGTIKRRWWCALYYLGKINTLDLLSSKTDGFANRGYDIFDQTTGPDDTIINSLRLDDDVIQQALTEATKFRKITVEEFIKQSPALKHVQIALNTYKTELQIKKAIAQNNFESINNNVQTR